MGFSIYDVNRIYSDYEVLIDTQVPDAKIVIGAAEQSAMLILSMRASNSGSAPIVLDVWADYNAQSSACRLASVAIPAGAGFAGVPALDVLAGLTITPLGLLAIQSRDYFLISLETAPATGETVTVATVLGLI